MAATPTLTCKQCNYENEPERVYCHNCGAKLDRSLLPKEPAPKAARAVEQNRKRIRKLVNPNRGFFTNWHRALLNVLCSAISIAALIQIVRPPDDVPPTLTKDALLDAPNLLGDIGDLQMSTSPQTRTLSEDTINLYLASSIHNRGDTSGDYFKFDRTFANLGHDVIKITAQESAFGYPLYASTYYKLSIVGNKLLATNVGGSLGRLPVHPMIMAYCGQAFDQLWAALQREKELLDRMQSISIQPKAFTYTTKPHA
jgi:hypothetical protein